MEGAFIAKEIANFGGVALTWDVHIKLHQGGLNAPGSNGRNADLCIPAGEFGVFKSMMLPHLNENIEKMIHWSA